LQWTHETFREGNGQKGNEWLSIGPTVFHGPRNAVEFGFLPHYVVPHVAALQLNSTPVITCYHRSYYICNHTASATVWKLNAEIYYWHYYYSKSKIFKRF